MQSLGSTSTYLKLRHTPLTMIEARAAAMGQRNVVESHPGGEQGAGIVNADVAHAPVADLDAASASVRYNEYLKMFAASR